MAYLITSVIHPLYTINPVTIANTGGGTPGKVHVGM